MTFSGAVHSIHLAPVASEPTVSVEQAHAVPGRGWRATATTTQRAAPLKTTTLVAS